jgi:hypothetical protein
MVRDDTAIRRPEQGQLSTGRGTIILPLPPVVRRTARAMPPDCPIRDRTFNSGNSVDEDTNHAASREIDSEWFWDS